MFGKVICPVCGHNDTIPQNKMGQKNNCSNCKSPYLAGVPEPPAQPVVSTSPSPVPPINKTLMAPLEEPIRYNCPRCGKSLESPQNMGGQKLNCSACGQRLQIPQPPAPALPPLNKTLLAVESTGPGPTRPPPLPSNFSMVEPEVVELEGKSIRRELCLECRRDITGRESVLTCPRCGSLFCSAPCYRDHHHYAHGPEHTATNGMAVAGMVLGIVGFVFAFIPCIGWIALILGILGIIFSGVGLAQAGQTGHGKGMGITGLVLSILAIIWWPLFYFLILASLAGGGGGFR